MHFKTFYYNYYQLDERSYRGSARSYFMRAHCREDTVIKGSPLLHHIVGLPLEKEMLGILKLPVGSKAILSFSGDTLQRVMKT